MLFLLLHFNSVESLNIFNLKAKVRMLACAVALFSNKGSLVKVLIWIQLFTK